NHGLEEQKRLNPVLRELADRYGVGMVATNDGHYVRREDAHAHDVLLAIQTKEMVASQDRMRFPCDEFYVKTPEEMAAAVPESGHRGAPVTRSAVRDMRGLKRPMGKRRVYRRPGLKLREGITPADGLRVQTSRGAGERSLSLSEAVLRPCLRGAAAQERP